VTSHDIELDYGLAPGETFEPDPLPDELDPAQPHVPTMLGPIEPGALGMAMVVSSIAEITGIPDADPMEIIAELEAAYAIGLRSLILLPDSGETEGEALLSWIAARSPVHLVQIKGCARSSVAWDGDVPPGGFTILTKSSAAPPSSDGVLLGHAAEYGKSLSDTIHALPLGLMESGFSARQVRQMLVDNPAVALTTQTGDQK
jgi:hypothetical protein